MYEIIEFVFKFFMFLVEFFSENFYILMIFLCLMFTFLIPILNEYNQDKDKFMKILQKCKNKSDLRSNFTLVEMKKDL